MKPIQNSPEMDKINIITPIFKLNQNNIFKEEVVKIIVNKLEMQFTFLVRQFHLLEVVK